MFPPELRGGRASSNQLERRKTSEGRLDRLRGEQLDDLAQRAVEIVRLLITKHLERGSHRAASVALRGSRVALRGSRDVA